MLKMFGSVNRMLICLQYKKGAKVLKVKSKLLWAGNRNSSIWLPTMPFPKLYLPSLHT